MNLSFDQKSLLCLCLLSAINLLGNTPQTPSPETDSTKNTVFKINELKNEISEIKRLQESENRERVEHLISIAEQHITTANRIIDWSGMFFALLTVILIIAGSIGLKEFSNIRRTETQMRTMLVDMKTEFENIRKTKAENLKDFESLKQKIEQDSKDFFNIIHLFNEGVNYYHSGDLLSAIYTFRTIKKLKPDDYKTRCYLALSYSGKSEFELAIKEAYEASKLSEKPVGAFSIIGEIYRRMKEYDKSIEILLNALEIEKKPPLLNNLAFSYLHKGQIDDAEKIFKESLELNRNPTACSGLARVLTRKNKHTQAVPLHHEAITLAKQSINKGIMYFVFFYYTIAFSYMALNNESECLSYLKTALTKNKDPELIKGQIADFTIMKGVKDISQELLKKCLKTLNQELARIQKKL